MKTKAVIIVGGGLAGLTAGIHLSKQGIEVKLFEKEQYPRHKVCGEYLSKEVDPYLQSLGIDLEELNPKAIDMLLYSTPGGGSLEVPLAMGAFGLSRYTLDHLFYRTAKDNGVEIIQEKVLQVQFSSNQFLIETKEGSYPADYVLGGFGKRSLLDKKLNRQFFNKPAPWVAVKGHFKLPDFPDNLVALHNFTGGYCGISKIETGEVNLCYLASYKSFQMSKNPEKFVEEVLKKNPHLFSFFNKAQPVFERPLTIAQISFEKKQPIENHILMIGDAAGLIHPLCGNGMAIAIHSAKLASENLLRHMKSGTSRENLEEVYKNQWESHFTKRFKTASWLQKILLKERATLVAHQLISRVPGILPHIIKQTHGQPIS